MFPIEERRRTQRRTAARGYDVDRRQESDGGYLGQERRTIQRRKHDRRRSGRRADDLPFES